MEEGGGGRVGQKGSKTETGDYRKKTQRRRMKKPRGRTAAVIGWSKSLDISSAEENPKRLLQKGGKKNRNDSNRFQRD